MNYQPTLLRQDVEKDKKWYRLVLAGIGGRGVFLAGFMFVALVVLSTDLALENIPKHADAAILVLSVYLLARASLLHVRSVFELMGQNTQRFKGNMSARERRAALLTEYKLLETKSRPETDNVVAEMPYIASKAIDVVADNGSKDDVIKTMNEIYQLQAKRLGGPLARLWILRQSVGLIAYLITRRINAAIKSIVGLA